MALNCQSNTVRSIAKLSLLLLSIPSLAAFSGCSVAAGAGASSPVQKEQASYATGIVPAEFFGMVVKQPGVQPAVRAGARRLWDSGVSWAAVEPAPGSFDWSTLDQEVASAETAGAEVTLTLGMTPTWASSQPALPSNYGDGATAMPVNLADWDAYVLAVATRYRGRIHGYEVWNAPENPAYFAASSAGLGADMALLAKHAASVVHAADPSAVVISPALSAQGIAGFLSAGGAAVDVIGSSLNGAADTGPQAPEAMAPALQALLAAVAGTPAVGKPIWNEQSAWALAGSDFPTEVQAAYVARALLLNSGLGVQRVHWYAWDDADPTALQLSDAQGQPTEAAVAYNTVESWIGGAQMNGCAADAGGLWTCQLVRNGRTAWVLWSATGPVSASALGASTVTSLDGNANSVDGIGMLTVDASPVLLQ